MNVSSRTLKYGLLTAAACVALGSCSKLFSPCGSGEIPDTDQTETLLKAHVFHLADSIGERNVYKPGTMERSARYIEKTLADMGYAVTRQAVNIPPSGEFGAVKDRTAYNLIATKKGTSLRPRMLIVGAHYDTKVGMDNWHDHGPARPARTGTPGANDNASGVAAMLRALALFAERGVSPERDVVFLATDGEESDKDGARAFAALLEERYASVNLINIDCIGHAGRDFIDIYTEKQAGINPLAQALAEAGTAQGARVRQEIYSGDGAVLGIGNRLAVTLSDALYEGEAPHTAEDVPERLDYARIEGATACGELPCTDACGAAF